MLSRTRLPPSGFIEPCLPSAAEHPPTGPGWLHEIKHDGFRLMARRDAVGVRLFTRNGIDWSGRSLYRAGDKRAQSAIMPDRRRGDRLCG
jgi:bifunctional non-homologous end joining protein LigD